MMNVRAAALGALLVALPHSASATPCVRKEFKTQLVKSACERGGQEAAKDAMKAFNKSNNIKSCNQCHAKLAPSYELKADGVEQFAKLGGVVVQVVVSKGAPVITSNEKPVRVRPTPAVLTPSIPVDDPVLVFDHYTLPNGLDVILVPDKAVPMVAVDVWYHVGSGSENVGKTGFAHLFEHMMFQGSQHVGEDRHFEILKKIGESGVNGSTNPDRTNYFELVPSNQLETALWLESDRMGYLLRSLTGKDGKPVDFRKSLDNQIDVVRNERRQRYDNVPYGKARFAEYAGLYPEGHPYRYLTIGKHEDLVNASVADVQGFFKTWYVPANATLAIVGDFELAEGRKLVDKWFAQFPKSGKPKVITVPAPTIKSSETTVSDSFAKLRQIKFSWHSPGRFAEGDAELDIVANALSREGPGRLYRALVYDRPLAQSVNANQGGVGFSGIFSITVTLRGEAKLDEVKQIVAAEVARIVKDPLTAKELARVVVGNEASTIRGLESLLGRAEELQSYNHYLGDPNRISWDLDRYRKTTVEKIRDTAAKYLLPGRMVTTITNPGGKP
jgi:predicted Zn-dependent peptidase